MEGATTLPPPPPPSDPRYACLSARCDRGPEVRPLKSRSPDTVHTITPDCVLWWVASGEGAEMGQRTMIKQTTPFVNPARGRDWETETEDGDGRRRRRATDGGQRTAGGMGGDWWSDCSEPADRTMVIELRVVCGAYEPAEGGGVR